MTMSHWRGWPIEWDGTRWLFSDDKTPVPGYGGQFRPCKKCGAVMNDHEADKCLGQLPGVRNACCGHGVPSQAYISFHSGLIIEGFSVTQDAQEVEP
jgi:hypothetical protein